MKANVEELFHEVADLSAEERARYFDEHGIDLATRDEVTALLEFDGPTSTVLEGHISSLARRTLARFETQETPCGPYRLGELLGRGGMGAVYLAERIDGEITQRVAVKLLRPGAEEPHIRARFLAERQILAKLAHPNIARLLDAGHREDGQPYLVMEHIEGKPIDEYTAGLSLRNQVTLFLKVCAAVGYLHRNLVVHRDLKPSNILVNGDGEPKLLDFGIAKMLDLTTDATVTSMRMLTPDYASPEQATGEPVTTATDIYSLGAVLYKILTGQGPHKFEGDSVGAVARAFSSGKITSPAKLAPALKGDLEMIVMKALRREPQERYATIEQFSEDLEGYLESRPIRARKGDTWYRMRKFLRRYWLPVTAGMVAMAGVTGGALVANYQRAIAQQRFVQVRQLAGRFIELHDDVAQLPGSTKVRDKMVATALDYLDNLSRSAGNDSALLAEIGSAYEKVAQAQGAPGQPNLGHTDDAITSFRKAIAFESRAAALDPAYRLPLAFIRSQLAYLSMLHAHLPEARENLEAAASLLEEVKREHPSDIELLDLAARIAINRADLSEYEGGKVDRLPLYQQAAELQYEYVRRKPDNAAKVRAYRATTLFADALADKKRYEEALAVLHARDPLIDGLLAAEPDNPVFLRQKMTEANYEGDIYDNEYGNCLGKPREAVPPLRRYVDLARKLSSTDPNNASARLSLGIAYYKLSWSLGTLNPPESLQMARNSLRIFDEDLARSPQDRLLRSRRARALRHLAYAERWNHQDGEARRAIQEAITIQQKLVAESPSDGIERDQLKISRKVAGQLSNP